MTDLSIYVVHKNQTIREGFKKLDQNRKKFVLIEDDNQRIIGIVTDGDFRRAIWHSISLEDRIESITNTNFIYFSADYQPEDVRFVFSKKENIRVIPILKQGLLTEVLFREHFSQTKESRQKKHLDFPVVIMAGGKGTRLDPFTRILPKPLIPIGNRPVIEIIMDTFAEFGMQEFYLSVHEKSRMIKAYFEDFGKKYQLNFIEETEPLGTIGSLSLLKGRIDKPFFVSNCDIVIDAEYNKIFKFHRQGGFSLTLVGSVQHYRIPYGVCEVQDEGQLLSMKEKPEFDFVANTGFYLMEPDILDLIPERQTFDITQLIEQLKQNNKKIGVYPVSEKSWLDVGQWEEYQKTVNRMNHLLNKNERTVQE